MGQVMRRLPAVEAKMHDMELTNVLWACGKLGFAPEGAFERLIPLLISRRASSDS